MASAQDTRYGQKDSSDQNFDYMFKLLIIGNSSVGKTSFLFRYADDSFTSAFVSTVGIDFKVKTVFKNEKRIKLQIWVSGFELTEFFSLGHWTRKCVRETLSALFCPHGVHKPPFPSSLPQSILFQRQGSDTSIKYGDWIRPCCHVLLLKSLQKKEDSSICLLWWGTCNRKSGSGAGLWISPYCFLNLQNRQSESSLFRSQEAACAGHFKEGK